MNPNVVLEWLGSITGLVCVWLTVRQRILCWPVGIISVIAFFLLFLRIKLYAEASLQVFYVVTSIYGWWAWAKGGERGGVLQVRRLSARWRTGLLLLLPLLAAASGWVLHRHTDAALPYWDTAATVVAVAAQLLLMRKIYECWMLWVITDILSIGLYAAREVWITAGLYVVFLVLASIGWREWHQVLRRDAGKELTT